MDTTGALEKWCIAKWGPCKVGVWSELQGESTEHLREIDKLLFWIRRAWFIVWKATIDYLPPIACDLILSLISNISEVVDDITPIQVKLYYWRCPPVLST